MSERDWPIEEAPSGRSCRYLRIFEYCDIVLWSGEQDDRGKNELLGHALALLAPIEWDEPFGITIVEALAAGTPVISRPRGSLPELVRHGEHGFLVETEDEMVAALSQLEFIDRRRCREWAVRQFSVEQMVDGYERVYHAVLARARARAQQPAVPTPARPEVTLAVEARSQAFGQSVNRAPRRS